MDTFIIQDQNSKSVTEPSIVKQIEDALIKAFKSKTAYKPNISKRRHRHQKVFNHPTQIHFEQDTAHRRTVMEINTMDMPGMLSTISHVIALSSINITHAKISTLGERINDIFYLSTTDGNNIIDQSALNELESQILKAIAAINPR